MSIEQYAGFLNTAQVPLRLSVVINEAPLIVPLWFVYLDGALWCACQRDSYLVRSIAKPETQPGKDRVCGFDISTNTAPYQGVAGTGYVSLHMNRGEERLSLLVERYLEDPNSAFAQWLLARAENEVALCIRPTRVRGWDFTDRMS